MLIQFQTIESKSVCAPIAADALLHTPEFPIPSGQQPIRLRLRAFVTAALSLITAVLFFTPGRAQNTMGLLYSDSRASAGYTLFAPMSYTSVYLIDMEGRLVHRWDGAYTPGLAVYLLENGNLIRMCRIDPGTPEGGGRVEEVDWDGNTIWSLDDKETDYEFHHDVTQMPNGNFLIVARETKSKQEAINAGRDPQYFANDIFTPDVILELKPNQTGSADIVWEWHFWDHMSSDLPGEWMANDRPVSKDITDPAKININFIKNGNPDWLHCNGVDYNPALDQIAISGHNPCEIYVISHKTANYSDPAAGIEAARGPEGDFLYRWGNPAVYGMGLPRDKKLFGQHDIHWIREGLPGAGHFLVYNNGLQRPAGAFSTVEEFVPPLQPDKSYLRETGKPFGPETRTWLYRAPNPTDFYSQNISSAQRLPNGNTLICAGSTGTFFEVTPDSAVVWRYINPVNDSGAMVQGNLPLKNAVFKCRRYPAAYPGFHGRDLTPGEVIEQVSTSVDNGVEFPAGIFLSGYPNPASSTATLLFSFSDRSHVLLGLFDMLGREVLRCIDGVQEPGVHTYQMAVNGLPEGKYFVRLYAGKKRVVSSLQIIH